MTDSKTQAQSRCLATCIALAALTLSCSSSSPSTAPATTSAIATAAAPPTTLSLIAGLAPGVPGDLPDGTYSIRVTNDDLTAVNIRGDNHEADRGTFEWDLIGGVWTVRKTDGTVQPNIDTGTYEVVGNSVRFHFRIDFSDEGFTWVANPDGTLQLTALASTSPLFTAWLSSHPLVPVAGG